MGIDNFLFNCRGALKQVRIVVSCAQADAFRRRLSLYFYPQHIGGITFDGGRGDMCAPVPFWGELACEAAFGVTAQQPADHSTTGHSSKIRPTSPCAFTYNYAKIRRLVCLGGRREFEFRHR